MNDIMDGVGWSSLNPKLSSEVAQGAFKAFVRELSELSGGHDQGDLLAMIDERREVVLKELELLSTVGDRQALAAAVYVASDLAKQGYELRVTATGEVEFAAPMQRAADADLLRALKDRRRRQLHVERDEQLKEPATREFIKSMERKQVHIRDDGTPAFVSIFSLMRDGQELAGSLREARERSQDLRQVIDPYLQVIKAEERCVHTGLMLRAIWRYFRHTWSNSYKSVPGRSMMVLVRDRARPYHPVIGIASLSSPTVQIRQRDVWIGWHSACLPGEGEEGAEGAHRWEASDALARWAVTTLSAAIEELYIDDFIAGGLLTPQEVREPTSEAVERLTAYAREQREKHYLLSTSREHKRAGGDKDAPGYWIRQATSPLFCSKRAATLADLLMVRMELAELADSPEKRTLSQVLSTPRGRRAMRRVVRKAKADRVGVAIADINVCGAIPPYNGILGGKLVSMLVTSPEIVEAYRERYGESASIIASSMAGRPVKRPPHLVLLTTTSLYGHSSQYNRITIPREKVTGERGQNIKYIKIGATEGYGTDQFGSNTVEALVLLDRQRSGLQRSNDVFGEGVNPRMRKIRQGLDILGLPSDALLRHGNERGLYMIPLAQNFREVLLGLHEEPDYYLSNDAPSEATSAIASWWIERWLEMRIQRERVLQEVARHTLVRPISHGARVRLPQVSTQELLFDPYEG